MTDMFLTLAQNNGQVSEEGLIAMLAAMGFILVIVGIIVLAIWAVTSFFLAAPMKRLPESHRQLSPALIWVLNFPIINLVGTFFIVLKVSDSLKEYLTANAPEVEVGDAAKGLGIGAAACNVAGIIIPFAGLAYLVLIIIYMVKTNGLGGQIGSGPGEVSEV